MASTNDAVFYRRNKQIQDAIDSQNMKQALNLIDKRIKKGEDTVFLKAWKAQILFRHTDKAHYDRGISETLELAKAEPPISDIPTLDMLHTTLIKIGYQDDTIRSLWENAMRAKPQDRELHKKWFAYAYDADDWVAAQKAAMSLQKHFPNERKYHFWAIFFSYLVSVDFNNSDTDRKILGALAYRMISKAAESVPSDPKQLLSPPRAIQNDEEMLLLVTILESQERHAEVVKLLDSETVGLDSRILQDKLHFMRKKFENIEKAQMWDEGFEYVRSLLTLPDEEGGLKALHERDDWAMWAMLGAATRHLNTEEIIKKVYEFIDQFLKFLPRSRNAQLFRVAMIVWEYETGRLSMEKLFAACQEYFDNNKTNLYCFFDLSTYLSIFDDAHLSKFIEYAYNTQGDGEVNPQFKAVPMIIALKLDYRFLMSRNESDVSRQRVENFVIRCLQTYRENRPPKPDESEDVVESQPSDELLLLAAMALIRFSDLWADGNKESTRDIALIRASAILGRLFLDSPQNYHALLLQVRICHLLGAGSLALKAFSALKVKNLQWESVAHILYTRFATVHPHSGPITEDGECKDFDPQAAMVEALAVYRNTERTSLLYRNKGLDLGTYINVEETIELHRRLKESMCRKMFALEVRRMQRLVGGDPMDGFDDIALGDSSLQDQREFTAFMNCEPEDAPAFEERVRVGPLPGERWVRAARVADHLFNLINRMVLQMPGPLSRNLPDPEEFSCSYAELEMTATEREVAKINYYLLNIALFMVGSTAVAESVETCLAVVEEWLNLKLNALALDDKKTSQIIKDTGICVGTDTPAAPSWRYLHEVFLTLESVKAVSSLMSLASKKGSKFAKLPKERVETLARLAPQVHESVRQNTRTLKSRISECGILGNMIEFVLSGPGKGDEGKQLRAELEQTLNMSELELFCGTLMESWEEGLEGVMDVVM